ncbi:MAG: glycosyltransferase family 4 protein [Verrucomicrobiales bacterium]|nr:glycosyltransferase family 4 protein [Verrucomicrobiales bacterium]
MKIGLVRRGYSATGGAEKYLLRFAAALEETGHEAVLFTDRKWPEDVWGNRETVLLKEAGKSPRQFADALEKAGPKDRCDILFSLERVWDCDVYRAGDGVHAAWLERRARFEPGYKSAFRQIQKKHRELLEIERSLFSPEGGVRVIANSEMVKREIESHFGLKGDRVSVIPNGFDAPERTDLERQSMRDSKRKELGLVAEERTVLFVGSGWERKGLRFAIEAVEEIGSGIRLVIAGTDRRSPKLSRPELVKPLGPVSDLEPLYEAADLFVLPTIYDPFSNASLEAAAFGLPVITSDANGLADHIPPLHGAVVPVGETLVGAFQQTESRADENREIVREQFSTALNRERTLDFLTN